MNKYQAKHKMLIEESGGKVQDIFVEEVGVLLTKKPSVSEKALDLFEKLNIDNERPEYEQHAEFNSRLTYLSFKNNKESSKKYNEKMINEYGHRSVYNDEQVTFLIAGCSIETMLEFIAHNEATIARLTSSKTNAQNETLYRIRTKGLSKKFIEIQKKMIKTYLSEVATLSNPETDIEKEITNILNLGNKAVSFTISMSIKDWHKTLIGRLSHHGVETEMLEILEKVVEVLKTEYPIFFKNKEEYYEMNNNKKYEEK